MAMTLADVRAKYPAYAKVPDQQLADALYKKYYPTADRHEFDLRVGLAPSDNALQVLGKDIANAPGVVSDQLIGAANAATAGVNNLVNGTPQPGGPVLPPIIPGVVGGPDLSGSLGAVLPDNVKRAIGETAAKAQLRGELAQQQNAEDRQKIELPSNSPLATGNEVLSTVGEMAPAVALSLAAKSPAPMIALGGAQSAGGAYTAATAPGFAAPGTPLVSDATAAQLHGFTPDEVDQIAANETGKVPRPFTAVSPNQALAAAAQYGVVGGAAADIGAGPLLKEGMPVFQRIVTEALVNAGVSAGSAALNSATDLAYTNPDLTVGQIVERVKGAAITGAAAGVVLGGGAALVHGARGRPAPLEPDVVPPPADAVAPEAAPVAPETPVVAPAPEPAAPPSEMVHRATEAVKATGQPVTPELVGTALHTMDPLGPFEPAQLPPEIVSHVEAWRTGNDQSVAKPITMADIARSGALHPETGVKTPALAIDQAILTKIPNADHGNFSVGDVLDAATNKNLVTDDSNFRALAERATGTPDVEKMTPVQLSALKHVIDGLPAHAEPTSIPIADAPPFGHEQLGRVQAALRQGTPYSAELVREQTGLTAKRDVDALRDALVRQGDLVKEGSNNFRPPTPDEAAARQAAQPAANIADEMATRFRAAGRAPEEAQAAAALVDSFYQTMAGRSGRSLDDLVAQHPLPRVEQSETLDAGDLAQAARGTTSSPEFKTWFGDSKVVDEHGAPLVVYHGSPNSDLSGQNFAFGVGDSRLRRTDFGNFGEGVYTTPAQFIAKAYATPRGGSPRGSGNGVTLPLYASIKNPLRIEVSGPEYTDVTTRVGQELGVTAKPRWSGSGQHNPEWSRQFREKAKAAGYDGVITQNTDGSMGSEVVAFDPTQIKSVANRGTFDPNDPRILFQPAYHGTQGPRGAIHFDPTGNVIRVFEHADSSTVVHELGHHFLTMFKSLAEADGAPEGVAKDWDAVKAWWRGNAEAVAKDAPHDDVKGSDVHKVLRDGTTGDRVKDLAVNVGLQEQFARAFELFTREGKAPNAGLRRVFEQFKQWLGKVYRSAKDLNVNVSDDVRGVFDRMLGDATTEARSRVPRSQTLRRAQPVESETAPGGTSLNQILNRGSFTPGVNHVPSYRDAGQPPRPVSNTVRTATATHLPLPTEDAPARRTPAITALKRIIGNRLFVGRVKGGKNVAGSYNTLSGAVRTRNFDDVETLWHEAAHWLDHGNRFKAIFAPLRDAHAAELDPLSYTSDPALETKEGFAEYVRLWGTNYIKARDLAPNFTKAFETTLKQTKLWQDMTRAQNLSHKFYFQGPIASLTSKIGEATPLERFTDAIRTGSARQAWDASTDAASLEYNRFIDAQHGLSAMEIALKGARGEGANSPYTLAVASRGTEGTTNAILYNGTATVAPNGDLVYDGGKGVTEIFAPVVKRGQRPFNDLMRYMAARRGEELGSQGREHLFTKEEIAANLALERKYPEFRKVFEEFQGFNHRMLDFLVQSNALTNEQRDNVLQRNANWVPFNRVIEHVMNGGALNGTVVKELRGSSRNSRDIMQNILQSVTNNVQAARVAQIKARTYQTILDAGDDGAPWAVEIPAGDKRIQLSQQQMKGRIGEVLRALGHPTIEGGRVTAAEDPISATPIDLDNMDALFQQFPEMATFWTRAQPPANGNFIDSAILDGKRRYFEIPAANALFIDTMTAINGSRMPEIKSDFVRGAFKLGGLSKRVQTRLITSMPQFWIRNLVRDNMDAAIQSQSGFRPVYDSIRGMTHDITKSHQQKLAELNGMYFSGQLMANTAAGRNRAVLDMPVQSIQEAALKAMNRYDSVVAIGEHSTRMGEYLRALDSGASMTEAAARGRTVTVDFAQMGSNNFMKLVASQTPFLNSSVQGNAQVAKALFQGKDGTMNFATPGPYMKLAGKLVLGWGGAMAAATAAIWVRNHNDKRYQALTSDQKSGAWHLYMSDDPADHGISIPKPYGAGFVFGDVVENLLDYSASHDGWGVAANLGAAFMQRFGVSNGIPGAIAPIYQGLTNTEWNGAPIVPDNLAKAPPYMQFRDSTPLIYDVVGQKLNISPLMAEHYVRGYLGYAAQVMEDSTQAMLWNKDQWGAMPFPPHAQDYLLHGVFQDHPDYRTKYTDAYYALRSQVTSMASAYRWARQNNVKDPGLFKGLSDDQVNQTLKSLGGRFAAMDKILGGFNQQVMKVKYDPKLSQQAKEQQIEALYAKHNDQLRTSYESVEATIKANGG